MGIYNADNIPTFYQSVIMKQQGCTLAKAKEYLRKYKQERQFCYTEFKKAWIEENIAMKKAFTIID